MRRVLQIAIFAVLGCSFALAQTTTTVTGTIRDLSQALVTSGKVTFALNPSRDTTISGYARFSPTIITCTITAAGLVKALDGVSVCTLTMNTALQPTGSYYSVCIWPANVKTSCFNFFAILSTYDITTIVPTPTTSPAQNFVDVFSNQSIGGNKTWLGQQVFSGQNTFSGTNIFPGVANLTGGAIVSVSGTGCGTTLQLVNIDVAPVSPNKYFRINQATGALEVMNSACGSLLLSLSEAGLLGGLTGIVGSSAGDFAISIPSVTGNGKNLTITPGAGTGGSTVGGSVTIRGNTGGLVNGSVTIGDQNTLSVSLGDTAGGTKVNLNGTVTVKGTVLYVFVASDFTLAANTNLQTITGLSWILAANTLQNVPFSCHLLYSQATAAVADQFGVQSSGLAPANLMAKAQVATSATAETDGNLPILNTTTATAIVTFTPSAITTVWNADIDGLIETQSGAQATINIMAQTSNAADLLTVKRGSFCRIN